MQNISEMQPIVAKDKQIYFRNATEKDQQSLARLVWDSPMDGSMAVYYNREPDFFAILKAQGDRYQTILAETEEGEVIASTSFSYHEVMWNGKKTLTGHASDLRVAPAYRGRKLARAMVDIFAKEVISSQAHHLSCDILKGNDASVASLMTVNDQVNIVRFGEADITQLLPLRYFRKSKKYKFRQATENDRKDLQEILKNFHKHYDGAPVFDDHSLEHIFAQPGFDIGSFWFAEKNGKIVATVAEWDQKDVRQLVVERYQFVTKLLVHFGRTFNRLLKIPKPPLGGEALPYKYLRFPICLPGEEDALKQLIRHRVTEIWRERSYLFILICFHATDPLKKVLRGIPRVSSQAMLFKTRKPGEGFNLKHQKLPYVDFSVC